MSGALTASVARRGPSLPVGWGEPVLAAGVVATALLLLAHGGLPLPGPGPVGVDPVDAVLTTLSAAPIALARWRPGTAVVLAAVASSLLAAAGGLVWPPLGVAAAVYLHARGGADGAARERRSVLAAGVATSGFFLVVVLASPLGAALHSVLACAITWLAGERARLRRTRLATLRTNADRVAREAVRERDLAVAQERARIARDLHDTTAHALNVIALRAGAARLRDDPAHAMDVLAMVEDLARATMAEVGDVVVGLRSTDAIGPPPGLAAVPGLVAEHRSAGHPVASSVSGQARALAPAADQGVFRIIQEALTNAARHGAGSTRLDIDHGARELVVRVRNGVRESVEDRAAPDARASVRSSVGHGLIGMQERADTIGAELTTGPDGEEFAVLLRLPWEARS